MKLDLMVAGEFWEDKQAYLNQVKQLGLEGQVRFDDRFIPDEEVMLYFAAADLFVAPYQGGTQSGSIRLAQGYQVPILASDRISADLPPSIPTFPSGNALALAAQIEKFIHASPEMLHENNSQVWSGLEKLLNQFNASQKFEPTDGR